MEGEVGWGGCDGGGGEGGGFDEPAVGDVNEEVKIHAEVGPVGSYKMGADAWTTTTMNHGLWEEGSAGARVNEKQIPVRESSAKKTLVETEATAKGSDFTIHFFDQTHCFSHFLAAGPKRVW